MADPDKSKVAGWRGRGGEDNRSGVCHETYIESWSNTLKSADELENKTMDFRV